jgi:GT2 family glycosyltransferase
LRPRASSANLLVRRQAFEQVGGYTEGIWAAEDTDFTWRLQAAGWTLAFNERAVVQHAYRRTLRELGRQWRGYAAGARWLSERYPDFKPDPGLNRGLRLILKRFGIGEGVAFRADGRSAPESARLGRLDRLQFLFVQVYLAIEEQIGLRMSNEVKPPRR